MFGDPSSNGIDIRAGALANVIVRNGKIRNCGQAGVSVAGSVNALVLENLVISDCGRGVQGFSPVTVRNCAASRLAGSGFDLSGLGSVLDCSVEKCTGGSFYAIYAGVVARCQVSGISATGGTGGIAASVTQACSVKGVFAAGGSAVGISGDVITDCQVSSLGAPGGSTIQGISGNTISRCSVLTVGTFSAGTSTGIVGGSVTACTVFGVGGSSSAGPVRGIEGATVSQCYLSAIGSSSLNQPVTGILAGGFASSGVVSDCSVLNILGGAAAVRGIIATAAQRCKVSTISQSGSGPGNDGYIAGIEAERISDCHVSLVGGASFSVARGLSNFRVAQDCVVGGVTDSVGPARGMSTTLPAVIDRSAVTGGKNGIYLSGDSSQVRNCTVTALTASGNENGGAIYIAANNCRVEGCTISGANVGVYLFGSANSTVDGNSFSSITAGVIASNGKVVVTRNRFGAGVGFPSGSPLNILFGPVVTGSGSISNANPWANFAD